MNSDKLLKVHQNQTLNRISQEKTVLCVNDTCQLDYTSQKKKEGKGTLQYKNQLGFLIHPLVVFTPKNVCLGVLDDFVYSRDPAEYGKKKARKKKPIQEKESYRWLQSYRKVVSYQKQCPETHLVYIADSEADIYDLFLEGEGENKPEMLVRATHNRRTNQENQKLWDVLSSKPVSLNLDLVISRTPKRKERTARAEIRFGAVKLRKPQGKLEENIPLYGILIQEIDVPEDGSKPIEWLLLSNQPVQTLKQAQERIEFYLSRWQIEVFFRTLKSGCKIEKDQSRLEKNFNINLVVNLIITWRVLYTTMLCRDVPESSCEIVFEESEWKALWVRFQHTRKIPKEVPSLREMSFLLARLGGYKQRKKDQVAGTEVIWRGFSLLGEITQMWLIMSNPD